MEAWNLHVYGLLNAGPHLAGWSLHLAFFAADGLIFLVPLALVAGWLWRPPEDRIALLTATAAIVFALAINLLINLAWSLPLPYMVPAGHTYFAHLPDRSFPSDHGTVMFTAAFVFVARRSTRVMGIGFLVLGVIVAWAYVFLGMHFPLDMLCALFVAALATVVLGTQEAWLEADVQPMVERVFHTAFAPLNRERRG